MDLHYQMNIFYDRKLGYYLATFPEVAVLGMVGTGSTYTASLTALLGTASVYTGSLPTDVPLGYKSTW